MTAAVRIETEVARYKSGHGRGYEKNSSYIPRCTVLFRQCVKYTARNPYLKLVYNSSYLVAIFCTYWQLSVNEILSEGFMPFNLLCLGNILY